MLRFLVSLFVFFVIGSSYFVQSVEASCLFSCVDISTVGSLTSEGDTVCSQTFCHGFDKEQMRRFREQARLKRRQFFITQMGLSDSEKEIFLKLFDKYDLDMHNSRTAERNARYSLNDAVDDAQREKLINIIIAEGDKQNNIRKEFLNNLKKTFSVARVSLFLTVEGEFNRQLVRSFEEKRK